MPMIVTRYVGGPGLQFFFVESDPAVELLNIQNRSGSSAGETQFK